MEKKTSQNFLKSPLAMILLFVVVFYAMTFAVYYFYGPGPEERRQPILDAERQQAQAVTNGEQKATVMVTVDDNMTQQNGSQEVSGTQQSQMSTQQAPAGV